MSPDTEDRDEPATEIETPGPVLDAAPDLEPIEAEAEAMVDTELEPIDEVAAPVEPEASPAPAPAPAPIAAFAEEVREAVVRLGEQVGRKLEGLQSQFDREVRAEANRERIVDRLHAELQEYKQDLLLKVQRPIFVDLIQLHDDVGKMAAAVAPDSEAFRGTLESIQTALEDVMYRQGVEPFRAEGDAFDPRRQRAVATVPTADPALAKTLAARIRPGFQAGDKVIRPEVVSVYTLQKGE
ncbi:nucleotide exchange factor GrpE [Planctomyces sp. SH-PL62]|uniref:nucleotide exchange factor GrpE n=1 Tax=Planctomyces sp. SH-PL62 TaxID=1636152 RepID=UPI00078DECE2|nr:nucleotide exchange factor GrpE [Planctomyces sp. SH-PL62]AMV38219.1 Protein GrpE [Planctomyces sp. SH-PL62]